MTNAMETGVPWMATGAVVIFLIACVWHNRRSGYQRVRDEKLTLGEAIARIRESLLFRHHALPTANWSLAHPLSQTEQLLSLSSKLGYQQTPNSSANAMESLRDEETTTTHK